MKSRLPVAGLLTAFGTFATDPVFADAAPGRYAIALDERIVVEDGSKSPKEDVLAAALAGALVERGAVLVDAEQTRALRAALRDNTAEGEPVLGPVTASDADFLVVGTVLGTISQPMGLSVHGCHLGAELQVVAVDSGQVVQAVSADTIKRGFAITQALLGAARDLGADLAAQIAGPKASIRKRFELHVSTRDRPSVELVERILRVTESLDGVAEVRLLNAPKNELRYELITKDADTRLVALALSRQPEAGLRVWGYSNRLIQADLVIATALRLQLVPTLFEGAGGGPARILPSALVAALEAEGGFEAPRDSEILGRRRKKRLLSRLRGLPGEALLLEGQAHRAGKKINVTARLVRARGETVVARGSSDCDPSALTPCMARLAAQLRDPALARMERTAGPRVEFIERERPLRVVRVGSADIFPVRATTAGRAGAEAKTPSGPWVDVRNEGDAAVRDIHLGAVLPGFGTGRTEVKVDEIGPGEQIKLRLPLVLNRERLRTHDDNSTTQLRLELDYRLGDMTFRDEVWKPVTIYHRNAMTWSEPEQIASFVTATQDAVQQTARSLVRSVEGNGPLARPIALFEGLRDLRYTPDPVNPYAAETVDYVQFPAQTLSRRSGDCDDLAVLFAALAEAVGLRALLVTTPGHIFVALPTDLPAPPGPAGLWSEGGRLMVYGGRYFVPLETTAMAEGFEKAWQRGARLVAGASQTRKLGFVDVRSAWVTHPPVDLSPAKVEPAARPPVDEAAVAALVEAMQSRVQQDLETRLSQIEAKLLDSPRDSSLKNQQGVAFVAVGRLELAQKRFAESLELNPRSCAPSNNLGNLALLEGEATKALHFYDEAYVGATKTREKTPIMLNRLLAAWMIDPSGPRFLELVLSANDEELHAFYDGVSGGPLRGTSSVRGQRRGQDDAELPVGSLVHWL